MLILAHLMFEGQPLFESCCLEVLISTAQVEKCSKGSHFDEGQQHDGELPVGYRLQEPCDEVHRGCTRCGGSSEECFAPTLEGRLYIWVARGSWQAMSTPQERNAGSGVRDMASAVV